MNPRDLSAPTGPTFPVAVLRLWGLLEGDFRLLEGVPESVTDTLPETEHGARCVDCWATLPFGLGTFSLRCASCAKRSDDEFRQYMADACIDAGADAEADAGADAGDTWPYFDADPWGDA
jgi:hypothetical protein